MIPEINVNREASNPSRWSDFLSLLKGQKVKDLIRYSSGTAEEYMEYYKIRENDIFKLSEGRFLLEFESGLIIGVAASTDLASVTVWIERDILNNKNPDGYYKDLKGGLVISALDKKYVDDRVMTLAGRKIIQIQILRRRPVKARFQPLPNEAGLIFKFDNGEELVATYNLYPSSDIFCVVFKDEIPSDIWDDIVEVITI